MKIGEGNIPIARGLCLRRGQPVNRNKSIHRMLGVVLCLVSPAVFFAQVNTARITGTVIDTSGSTIPGALAKLENLNTNVTRTAISESDGRFTFDFVSMG